MERILGIMIAASVIVVIVSGMLMSNGADKAVRDVKIIHPQPGIACAVVSRMFNSSISCWNEEL